MTVSLREVEAGQADPSHGEIAARIREITARLEAIPGEIKTARRTTINEEGIRSTLEAFGPVWDSLWPTERSRILRLLTFGLCADGIRSTIGL